MANRLALIGPAVLGLAVTTTSLLPAVSRAAECGEGTVYDAPSDTCVVLAQATQPVAPPPAAPPPPPPPAAPPPPAWGGYYGPRPYVSASICAPIPIIRICAGI
ncbi:hypothetical protein GCM10023161_31190 [Mycobacterium paraffinicum]|uniref:RNA-binding protein n=1 Tax=Mycobacterium paraffinicum TaxID=53378 RepID=A0ABP8RRC0_9MYCO